MATFFSSLNSKRYGPQYSKDNATAIALVKNPVKADSWAQMQAKIVAQAAITGADISFIEVGNDLQVTVNGKSGIDQSQAASDADDICMAILYEASQEVTYCIDVNDRVVTNEPADTIDLPATVFYIREMRQTA